MSFSLVEKNTVIMDDCLNIIKYLDDESIDAIITDFPYGINYQSNHREKKFEKIKNDEKPFVEWIRPVFQKLKSDGGRLVCFYRYDVQEELLSALESAGFEVKSQLVWVKNNWSSGDLKSAFGIQHELMIYATKGNYEFKNGRPSSVYSCPRVDSKKMVHPNEKPVDLIRAIVRDVTEIDELIFEPFSGSGSLPVAATIEKRNYIACDNSQSNVDIANKRLKNLIIPLI